MSLVANPINFASISVSGPLQIVILIYWPCVQKMEVVTIFDFLPHCGDVDDISNVVVWQSAFDGEHRVRETTVSRSQVPPASRDNHLICIQEVR